MAQVDWSLTTFNESTGRERESRCPTGYGFLDAAQDSLVLGNRQWFVSARLPAGGVLTADCVRALIDARRLRSCSTK